MNAHSTSIDRREVLTDDKSRHLVDEYATTKPDAAKPEMDFLDEQLRSIETETGRLDIAR
jgi:hypothetical protein